MNEIMDITSVISEEYYCDKSVLVTGGAGFVGSWLCEALLSLGARVICLDNFSSGQRINLSNIINHPLFTLIDADVSDHFEISEHLDYVFHLASRAGPFEFEHYPIEIIKSNTIGTLNALEIAHDNNANFLFTSTSETYGNPSVFPTPETYHGDVNSIGPRGCYDESKRCGEALCMAYLNQKNVNVRVARIFNTYGPRIRADGIYGRVIPRFIDQALNDKPITIFGDGSQTRCFCYVTDTVTALMRLAAYENCKGEVVNIGSENEMTVISLAETIRKIVGSNAEFVYSKLPKDDPKRRLPDIRKAYDLLGWAPAVTLQDGIKNVIASIDLFD